jgi:hypothetical protein
VGEHRTVAVVQRGEQVHRPVPLAAGRAAQGLAVDPDRSSASWARRAQPVGQPGTDGGVQRVGVHPCQRAADRGLVGNVPQAGERIPAGAERGQDRLGRVSSHSWIAVTDRAPASTAAALTASTPVRGCRRPRRSRGSGIAARRSSKPGHSLRASGRGASSWAATVGIVVGGIVRRDHPAAHLGAQLRGRDADGLGE